MLLLVALFLRSVLCVSISAVCCSCHSRELGTRQTVLDIFFPSLRHYTLLMEIKVIIVIINNSQTKR